MARIKVICLTRFTTYHILSSSKADNDNIEYIYWNRNTPIGLTKPISLLLKDLPLILRRISTNVDYIPEILKDTYFLFIIVDLTISIDPRIYDEIFQIAKTLSTPLIGITPLPFGLEGSITEPILRSRVEEFIAFTNCVLVLPVNRIFMTMKGMDAHVISIDLAKRIGDSIRAFRDIIFGEFIIGIDLSDMDRFFQHSPIIIMGGALASGKSRAYYATLSAIDHLIFPSPTQRYISSSINSLFTLIKVASPEEVSCDEINLIFETEAIELGASRNLESVWALMEDNSLDSQLAVSIIAGIEDVDITLDMIYQWSC